MITVNIKEKTPVVKKNQDIPAGTLFSGSIGGRPSIFLKLVSGYNRTDHVIWDLKDLSPNHCWSALGCPVDNYVELDVEITTKVK